MDLFGGATLNYTAENVRLAINGLTEAMDEVKKLAEPEEYSNVRIALNRQEPEIDIAAIKQLFDQLDRVLEDQVPKGQRETRIDAMVGQLDKLQNRLKKAGDFFNKELFEVLKKDEDKIISRAKVLMESGNQAHALDLLQGYKKLKLAIFPLAARFANLSGISGAAHMKIAALSSLSEMETPTR